MNLKGKCAIVTAGASGIGRVTARTLLEHKVDVAICDINQEALDKFSQEFPKAYCFPCDVGDALSVQSTYENMLKSLGGVDILVNNAGTAGPTSNIEDIKPEEWANTLNVNLTSQFLFTRAVVPQMKAQRSGAIVNMSSVAGRLGMPMRAPYVSAKWATIGLTQTMAMELGAHNIRVNAILPGSVNGERMDRVLSARAAVTGLSMEQVTAEETSAISLGRFVEAQEIADMIAFICSDHGQAISGQSIGVCGNTEILR